MVYIHVVCAILLSSFSTYANANGGQQKKGQSSNAKRRKKRSTQQKLKVIKNANLMLLLPDSLTLCALTVVSQHVVFSVVSCLVSFVLLFSFALGPQIVAVIIRCRCLLSLSCGPLLSLVQNRKWFMQNGRRATNLNLPHAHWQRH